MPKEKLLTHIEANTKLGLITYTPIDRLSQSTIPAIRRETVAAVIKAITAYRSSVADLLMNRHQELRELLPTYLTEAALVMVTCTQDGIIVRYDRQQINEVVGTWSDYAFP